MLPAHSALGLLARQYAALAVGQPANDIAFNSSLENWGGFALDEFSVSAVMFMLLGAGYIPRFAYAFSKAELLDLINKQDNMIIYYSGHGGSGTSGDALAPGYDSNGKPEFVYASDIRANARIAFLNSCKSSLKGSFSNAFGPRNELVLGWNNSIDYIQSSYFGYTWWKNMTNGMTAFDSAFSIAFGLYIPKEFDLFPNNPKIIISNYATQL
ncbi:hypothetical protein [Geotalea toluenoxydans]|uniref:hypothetical protein n=1 Tax=Geotalea toluenoxydans TaxID=421624 RepID=UPI0006D05CBB|nr:hypothetical protein [Geotalea toluenoxydans]